MIAALGGCHWGSEAMSERNLILATRDGDRLTLKILLVELRDPQLVYAVRDEMIDHATREIASGPTPPHLIVDCGAVEFMGSVGLLALLSLRRVEGVQRIVLCNLLPIVRGVLFTSRLAGDDAGREYPFEYAVDQSAAAARLSA
jgi:hypothetical protein